MRLALVNPNFGCREPHLPLELGCARSLFDEAGHDTLLVDAQLYDLPATATAPTDLFWRCPPPELRVPRQTLRALAGVAGATVAVGPHPSTTPRAALRKLGVDATVIGECEEVLLALAAATPDEWPRLESLAWRAPDGDVMVQGSPAACDLARTPSLRWSRDDLARHRHHHHRCDAAPPGPGAEVEATRGCPHHCTFCNKENVRNAYRKRPSARCRLRWGLPDDAWERAHQDYLSRFAEFSDIQEARPRPLPVLEADDDAAPVHGAA